MFMNRLVLLVSLLAMVVVGAACSSSITEVKRRNGNADPDYVATDYRYNATANLRKKFGVISINTATVSDNLLQVQVNLKNRTARRQVCNYRFEWIDRNGMQVTSVTDGWQTVTFMGGETRSVAATATNPNAVDFRFKFAEK